VQVFVGLPDPDSSIIKQKLEEKPLFLQFRDLSEFLSLKNDVNVPTFQKLISKIY